MELTELEALALRKSQIEKELDLLKDEQEWIQRRLDEEEDRKRKEREEQEKRKQEEDRRQREFERGTRVWCSNDPSFSNQYDFRTVTAIGFWNTKIVGTESGRAYWDAGIPKGLDNKLRGRQDYLPTISCLALGSNGRYLVAFTSGEVSWIANDEEFDDTIRSTRSHVKFASFGVDDDSWVIGFENGTVWRRNVPDALNSLLRDHSLPIRTVSLSWGEAYAVVYEDGYVDVPPFLRSLKMNVRRIESDNATIREILFGDEDAYLIRYSHNI